MKPISVKALQYFTGKVVTVFVKGQLQRGFDDRQFNDYFVGYVDWINEDGLMTTHPVTGCKNYYCLDDIVGIAEEQVLDPGNPEEAELIKSITGKTTKEPENNRSFSVQSEPTMPQNNSPFADIDVMEDLARQAKELDEKRKKK